MWCPFAGRIRNTYPATILLCMRALIRCFSSNSSDQPNTRSVEKLNETELNPQSEKQFQSCPILHGSRTSKARVLWIWCELVFTTSLVRYLLRFLVPRWLRRRRSEGFDNTPTTDLWRVITQSLENRNGDFVRLKFSSHGTLTSSQIIHLSGAARGDHAQIPKSRKMAANFRHNASKVWQNSH